MFTCYILTYIGGNKIKRKILAIILIILFIATAINIQAIKIKKVSENKDCTNLGCIYGVISGETGGYPSFIPFAKVKIEGIRTKLCDILGGYRFFGLPLERSYTITAQAGGYQTDSKTVTLTKENRVEQVFITLLKDRDQTKEECNTKGMIYGHVYETPEQYYAPPPMPFQNVRTDYKSTKTNMFGFYKIRNLPLNEEIDIWTDSSWHHNYEKTVILTEENPSKELDFYLNYIDEEHRDNGVITGTVFGEIGGFQAYVPFADIKIEHLKSKKCGIQGGFIFEELEFDKEYNLTADAYGYYPNYIHLTLTKDNPSKHVLIVLDQDLTERTKVKGIKSTNFLKYLTNNIFS